MTFCGKPGFIVRDGALARRIEGWPAGPKWRLNVLLVALDPPAQFGGFHERREGRIRRQGGEPVFGRRAFVLRPFDEQPFFGIGVRTPAVGGADTKAHRLSGSLERIGNSGCEH